MMVGVPTNENAPGFRGVFCGGLARMETPALPAYGPGTIFFCLALKRLNSGPISGW